MIARLMVLLLAAFAPAAALRAQQSNVSLRIDFVAWGDDIDGLSLKADARNGNISALAFRYSQPVPYRGPALMEVHQTGGKREKPVHMSTPEDKFHEASPLVLTPAAPAAGDTPAPKHGLALELEQRRRKEPTLVALVPLPAGSSRATVLLAPAADGTLDSYVIDDDPAKLPVGQLRIHNLSPFLIAVRCNGLAGKELKIAETITAPAPDQQVVYELAYKLDGQWKVQENNIVPVRANEQAQMIILRSKNQFFLSTDGSSGGFLQTVVLRRNPAQPR